MNMWYDVVERRDLSRLKKDVQDLIDAGWIPQGGVCHSTHSLESNNYHDFYAQAMTLKAGDVGKKSPNYLDERPF